MNHQIRPRWILDEERRREIVSGMKAMEEANLNIPMAWAIELIELMDRLKEHYARKADEAIDAEKLHTEVLETGETEADNSGDNAEGNSD